ncbi:hypothetical protein GCM10009582_10150 [Arthrobacter flavus]
MGSTDDSTHGSANKRWSTPWPLWISLVFFTALSSTALPYVDSSPRAILAVTGPLIVLITIGFLIKFDWDRHKARSADTTDP